MNFHNLIAQGIQQLNNKQYADAFNLFTALQAKVPKDVNLLHLLAITEKHLGKIELCEKHLKKALKLSPNQSEILNTYANLLKLLNRNIEAKNLLEKAIKFSPNNIDSYINLGNLLFNEKKIILAINYYNKALNINKHSFQALLGLAICHIELQKFSVAEPILENLLAIQPNNKSVLHNFGLLYKQTNKIDLALTYFKKAITSSHGDIISRNSLAACFLETGQYAQAIKEYEKIISIDPLNKEAHSRLSSIKWSLSNKTEECFNNYQKAIEITNSANLASEYIQKLLYTKSYEKVITLCDQFIAKKMNNTNIFASKSQALRELGAFEEAIETCTFALKKNKHDLALKYEYGHALIAHGDGEKALKIFNQLCKIAPNNLSNFTLKSTCLKLLNKDKEYEKLCSIEKFISIKEIRTPPGFDSLDDFNDQLRNDLIALHNTTKHPLEQSLMNGTQTIGDLFPSKINTINLLDIAIQEQVKLYIQSLKSENNHPLLGRKLLDNFSYNGSWSVLLQQQGFHKNHYHSDGWISGPYYVALPKAINNQGEGWIEFGVPEFNMRHKLEADVIFKPQTGCLVLFPSYMWHGTRPFTTTEQRITVAFDVIPN